MHGTDVAYLLRTRYAMCGTDLLYAATRAFPYGRSTLPPSAPPAPIRLHAMSGTAIAYAATTMLREVQYQAELEIYATRGATSGRRWTLNRLLTPALCTLSLDPTP
eukprot:2107788-Rhodomonas_salina.2